MKPHFCSGLAAYFTVEIQMQMQLTLRVSSLHSPGLILRMQMKVVPAPIKMGVRRRYAKVPSGQWQRFWGHFSSGKGAMTLYIQSIKLLSPTLMQTQ